MTRALPCAVALACAGCELQVTQKVPTYQELDEEDRDLVDRIVENLAAFDQALTTWPRFVQDRGPSIEGIVGREHVQVSFPGELLLAANLGDGLVRVTPWRHLGRVQRERVAGWWELEAATAEPAFALVAYEYMVAHAAALEYLYVVQGVARVFDRRPQFNVQRDAQRLVTAYFAVADPDLLGEFLSLCAPVSRQYQGRWPFEDPEGRRYFAEHLRELTDPRDPTGYVYYLCRWAEAAAADDYPLEDEMECVRERARILDGQPPCQGSCPHLCSGSGARTTLPLP